MRAREFIVEASTTLSSLYKGNYPDRQDAFWDEVTPYELDIPIEIKQLSVHNIGSMLMSQYRIEHIDELFDKMDDDQLAIVARYKKDRMLSNRVIVISGNRIIDGNHRALAAYLTKQPIRYVNLIDLSDEEDIDEASENREIINTRSHKVDIGNRMYLDISIDDSTVDVRVLHAGIPQKYGDDAQIGYAVFDRDGTTIVSDGTAISEEYRGQGIAKKIYDYVKELGFTIKRSSDQLAAGKHFWDKNKGEHGNVWEQSVTEADDSINEIAFATELGNLALSQKDIISAASVDGTIGSREVMLYQTGKNSIYFFVSDTKIDALVYLFTDRIMAMKNFASNKGLIYNLFQYIINIKKQPLRLSSKDKLTNDDIKWIIAQIKHPSGFKITDQKGKSINPKSLYDEWQSARTSDKPGPTEIVIGESKNSHQIRENEQRLMPMDIFGSTLHQLDISTLNRIAVPNLLESTDSEEILHKLNLHGSYLNDPQKKKMIVKFIKWASKKINLSQSPQIFFSADKREARCHHHTGSYDWQNERLWVYVGNRNMIDILRTLCHELVHAKQDQEGRIKQKSPPGSKLEREADDTAGYLIKLWGEKHHDIIQ